MRTAIIAALASAALAAPAAAQISGKEIFEGKGMCFACHGKGAAGTPLAPALNDTVWVNVDATRDSLIALITRGVPKPVQYPAPMPPMGGASLTRDEVAAVADYVLSLVKKPGS